MGLLDASIESSCPRRWSVHCRYLCIKTSIDQSGPRICPLGFRSTPLRQRQTNLPQTFCRQPPSYLHKRSIRPLRCLPVANFFLTCCSSSKYIQGQPCRRSDCECDASSSRDPPDHLSLVTLGLVFDAFSALWERRCYSTNRQGQK